MDLEQGLTAELNTIICLSGKVFPILTVQGTLAPYLTYTLGSNERTMNLVGHDGLVQSQYQLDVYHTTYAGLKALKKLVIANIKTYVLRNIGGAGPHVQQVEIINDFETYEDAVKLYKGVIEFEISHTE